MFNQHFSSDNSWINLEYFLMFKELWGITKTTEKIECKVFSCMKICRLKVLLLKVFFISVLIPITCNLFSSFSSNKSTYWVKNEAVICFYFTLSTPFLHDLSFVKGLKPPATPMIIPDISNHSDAKRSTKRLNFHAKQIIHTIFTDSPSINPPFNPHDFVRISC